MGSNQPDGYLVSTPPSKKKTILVNVEAKLLLISNSFCLAGSRMSDTRRRVWPGISEDNTFRQGDVWEGGGPNLSFAALGAARANTQLDSVSIHLPPLTRLTAEYKRPIWLFYVDRLHSEVTLMRRTWFDQCVKGHSYHSTLLSFSHTYTLGLLSRTTLPMSSATTSSTLHTCYSPPGPDGHTAPPPSHCQPLPRSALSQWTL